MKRRLLYLYLVALIASHLVARFTAEAPAPHPAQSTVTLPEFDGPLALDSTTTLAYTDLVPPAAPGAPVVVLLHGSPATGHEFDELAPFLTTSHRVLIPDLPGFGHSEKDVPDYSIEAHAAYTIALLDHLGISRAHVVGLSMGGGVALHIKEQHPTLVESITLLSSIGVQEHELLGDYTINHAVHALQLAALWSLHNLVPHFGTLDGFMLDVPYARNFADSDQRPLRGILSDLQIPVHIIHTRDDMLVPFSAAEEHARIVPHARTTFLDTGNHFITFTDPATFATQLVAFIDDVERDNVSLVPTPGRAAAAELPPVHRRLDSSTKLLVTVLVLLALATFASEDLTCLSAGLLVAKGVLGFVPATAACLVGIFVSDLWLYFMGLWFGYPITRRTPFRWFLPQEKLDASRDWFQQHAGKVIIGSRFLPGSRLPTYFGMGVAGVPLGKFIPWFALAALLWTPLLVAVAVLIGGSVLGLFEAFGSHAIWGVIATFVLFVTFLKLVAPLSSHKGRRLVLGRWRRLSRWEYWPRWALYPPVVLHILKLAVKHRSLTLFTAANPGIPAGGLVMESKLDILTNLKNSAAVARFAAVKNHGELRSFLTLNHIGFPVVLKPDIGERGQGVAVIHTPREADAYFAAAKGASVIAQEYIPGREFGVFYLRHPDEDTGRVFSVTDKQLTSVTGDGTSTIEDLILNGDRTVAMAPFFLKTHSTELHAVPAAGEPVPLTELGTHCRGATFLDANHLVTPELTAEIDRISKHFPGFHFGRYDLRVPGEEQLAAGQDIKILELNGVTSEATHIYDPNNTLKNAHATLKEQWTHCFEIAAANTAHGVEPATLIQILKTLRQYSNTTPFEAPTPGS